MTGGDEQTLRRVALLRGVNLGGGRTLPMALLRELATGLGWADVATHLQSGNLLFRAPGGADEVARALSEAVRSGAGLADRKSVV